ncbi:CD97 antigen-like [Sinocyclocheilus rhinocerous]|uniref:CD97 antigen-like n=1 Tax=Sinocyclocheilus rhinocerous TaxID=307959 RepID=UPI0007B8048D|nr:PREDICTED: CD97 antigen-like [Sinocyclocheilus rhinocerous]
MYCNTRMHNLYFLRYQSKNQYHCISNNCYCHGNKDTCTCYSSTLSSCFCETYNNSIALTTAVSSVTDPDCVRLNDMYICTGAQYRMYCNTHMHDFSYQRSQYKYQYLCVNNDCDCFGNRDTCTCSTSTLSSCFCKTYGNITALTIAVSPVYDCARYNDLYICTGAQYHMYCNTSVHDFDYDRYHYYCLNNNCDCFGNKDTCTCYSSTSSSCFCTNYSSSITIPAAVSPVYDCGLYNDTYICTGAQYHMYCDTRMHNFYYWKYRNQNQYEYECWGNNCYCFGNKDTCTCYSSTLSSCFCNTYGNITALTTAISPVYDCGLYNDIYICTGAQYRIYCDTRMNHFFYLKYRNQNQYECWGNNCDCFGNKDTCTCYSSTSSSCFCTNNSSSITIPAAVSPVYDCGLHNDTYICTGAQYRMFCNTRMHYFYYWIYRNQNQYECWGNNCYCFGNKDTCTCYSSTLSSCFCNTYGNITALTTAISPVYDYLIIALPDQCRTSEGCLQNLLEQIENSAAQELPVTTVMSILTVVFNTSEKILESSSVNPAELASYGNSVLKASEKLISTLVKQTDTSDSVSFTFAAVEIEVFMVGPQVTLEKIPRLDTTNSSVDIDLIGIARNNHERSAAVAFMSYNTMEYLLKPDFFNTSKDKVKTMMSTVISATLPKTTNTKLTKPVNFTLKHIREFDPSGSLFCVYWNISEWIVDGCSVLKTNSSCTVCSCDHLSTFALIMQTSRQSESDSLMELLNLVCVIVGLVFFSLALLTFALCQWSPGVNNVARINICISLLLAHLLFLLTQQFLSLIRRQQVLCAVISGLLHFLFLSGFVWMFIEAVLLFICVKNLSQISSKKREVLSSGFLCVIGYLVALVVVCVSVGLAPEGYGSKECWIKMDKGFIWSFLGPVCVILALNMILFIKIVISMISALKTLNAEVSQMKQTKIVVFKTLAQCVILGCSWILGFFTNGSKVLEILFLILNSQQGTFIFLIYCVFNNEVRQQYRKCFRCLCCVKQH